MAFCSNCGSEIKEGAKFCENCGAPVENAAEQPIREIVYEQTAAAPVVNTPEQESMAKSALTWSIVGLVLAEFGLPGIIVSAIAKGKVKKATAAGTIGGKLKAARILSNIGLALSIVMTIIWAIYTIVIAGVVIYGISEGSFENIGELENALNSL